MGQNQDSTNDRPGREDRPTVVVYHGEGDEPIEPEEQVAEVVQPIKPLITLGNSHMAEDVPLESQPSYVREAAARATTHIAHQTSAGELAQSVLQRCQFCQHFDPVGWGRLIRRAEASGDKRLLQALNEVRGEVAMALQINPIAAEQHDLDQSGDIDLEHALKSLGICKALTEHFKEDILVMPINPCAMPDFFKAKPELEARRAASSGFDWIMRRAQGRHE
jgi:hypothetical protein